MNGKYESPQRVRWFERFKYFIISGLYAAFPTAVVLGAWMFEISLQISTKLLLLGLYLAAAMTLFNRPVTGSVERSLLLTKAKYVVIGLGVIAAAGVEFLTDREISSGAVFLLIGAIPFYLLTRKSLWETYRERCHKLVDTYEEALEGSTD